MVIRNKSGLQGIDPKPVLQTAWPWLTWAPTWAPARPGLTPGVSVARRSW